MKEDLVSEKRMEVHMNESLEKCIENIQSTIDLIAEESKKAESIRQSIFFWEIEAILARVLAQLAQLLRNSGRTSILFLFLASCSHVEKRNKWSDKGMRIMIDPESVSERNYIRVTTAIVQSDKWTVVDRRNAYHAIKAEQEREHRQDNDRFDNKEKWAWWGKLYGIGSVVVPFSDCHFTRNVWTMRTTKRCRLSLTLADANTAEIITSVETEEECSEYETPSWVAAVERLGEAYPSAFESFKESQRLHDYRKRSEELAIKEQKKNEIPISFEPFGGAE